MRIVLVVLITGFIGGCNGVKNNNDKNEDTIAKITSENHDTIITVVNSKKEETIIDSNNSKKTDTELEGYDELSDEANYKTYTISEYNTDLEYIPNIKRPLRSSIKNFKFSKDKLFGIWVRDSSSEAPHATFQITKKSFYVVDYDGDGDMPYDIDKDSITVYYNDFIKRGKIINATSHDSLVIHWNESKRPTTFYKWKY